MSETISGISNQGSPRKSNAFNVARNLASHIISLLIQVICGLILTRFLIDKLGTELYGLVPLSQQIIKYFTLFTMVINASVRRYLTIALAKNDFDAARRTFNSAFFGLMLIVGLIVPVGVGFSLLTPQILDVPEGAEIPARLIFLAVTVTFFLVNIGDFFLSTSFSRNRLDLRNWITITRSILRTTTPLLLIGFCGWKLGGMSLGILLGGLAFVLLSARVWRQLYPDLKLSFKLFDRDLFRQMTSMSGWLLVNSVGRMLLRNVDLLIVNLVLGAAATGRYGSIAILIASINSFAIMINTLISPLIYEKYGKGESEGIHRLLASSMRMVGVIVALPLGLMIGFSAPLLQIWLGCDFISLAPVLSLLLTIQIITIPAGMTVTIFTSHKMVSFPALVTLGLGIINVLLSILLVQPSVGLGLLGLPIAMGITGLSRNLFVIPILVARLLKRPWFTYMLPLISPVLGCAGVAFIAFQTDQFLHLSGWMGLLTAMVLISIGYLVIAPFFLLTRPDRRYTKRMLTAFTGRGRRS